MKQRRHHFVWQHYLSAWSARQQITCLRNGVAFKASTINVAVEKDFYKIPDLTPGDIKILTLTVQQMPDAMRATQMGWLEMFTAPSAMQATFGGVNAEVDKILSELRFNTEEEFHTRIENDALPLLAQLRAGSRGFLSETACFQTFVFFLSLQFTRTQRLRDRLKIGLGRLKFPPDYGDVDPTRIAGVLRMIAATSLATHYVINREQFRLTMIEAASGAEFITGDQPVVNVYADSGAGFTPPSKIRLYYPLSPSRAVLVGDDRDGPMADAEIADTGAVGRYNALIAKAAQNELYGTSESLLRSAYEAAKK